MKIRFAYEQFCLNEACFIYGPDGDFGSNTRGNPQALFNISNNVPSSLDLVDARSGEDASGPITFEPTRNPDIFFFHPLIVLPHLFKDGVELSQLLLDNWWQVDDRDQVNGMTDEKVSFNYN